MKLADALLGERLPDLLPVEVKLSPETTYHCGNGMGHSCRCEDIGARYRVEIDALIPITGGPIQALNMQVIAMPLVSVQGAVVETECVAGRMVIERGRNERFDVEISPQTRIYHGNNDGLDCLDIRIDAPVRVRGRLFESPGLPRPVILADEIMLQGAGQL